MIHMVREYKYKMARDSPRGVTSIMCPFSVVELTSPVLIVGAYRAARYSEHILPLAVGHSNCSGMHL